MSRSLERTAAMRPSWCADGADTGSGTAPAASTRHGTSITVSGESAGTVSPFRTLRISRAAGPPHSADARAIATDS